MKLVAVLEEPTGDEVPKHIRQKADQKRNQHFLHSNPVFLEGDEPPENAKSPEVSLGALNQTWFKATHKAGWPTSHLIFNR